VCAGLHEELCVWHYLAHHYHAGTSDARLGILR
jgi:hypothetical protein